jgi:hypothetical protein
MDARLESSYLSSNYTTRNLSEDLLKLKTWMKTISFGSAKNIGKKEKYYLKKYLYIIKNFQTSIMIQ